jgi:hypothetical protein
LTAKEAAATMMQQLVLPPDRQNYLRGLLMNRLLASIGSSVLALFMLACGGGGDGSTASSSSAGTGGSGSGGSGTTSGGAGHGGGGGMIEERRVFVTSKTYNGALGGIAGADGACQSLAGSAGLGGTWKAWVGDGVDSPSTTFVQSMVPYVLVGGPMIADDWADLADGMLAAPIDHDETGAAMDPSGNTHVWTGASTTGSPLPYHCEGWTSTMPSFTPRGLWTSTDSTWVMAGPDPCATENHLYCFEQ